MDSDNLIRMANRIADFFAAMPDHEQAVSGVANHIQKFWEPRMKRQLQQVQAGAQAAALHPLVCEAMLRAGAPSPSAP